MKKNLGNPVSPAIVVTIDGEEFPLRFDLEAISEAEDATGMALIAGLRQRDVEAPRISLVRALFWACARAQHPKLTLDEARRLVTQHNWSDVWGKVLEAWVEGMKKPAEDDADPPTGQS
jgi:hypothetical protein